MVAAANENKRERDYWLNKLHGELVKTYFAYDEKEGSTKETEAIRFKFEDKVYSDLMGLSKGVDYTLYMILEAGVNVLLSRYTGNKDIIIVAPISKQEEEGEFINTVLVLRNQLNDSTTFKELLINIRQTFIDAHKNQNYPIEALLYKLNIELTENEFPLADVAVLLDSIHDKRYIQHLNLNMIFTFIKNDTSIEGIIEYNSKRYRKETIERIISHFINILQAGIANINEKLDMIEMFSQEEKNKILYEFNSSNSIRGTNDPSTIYELFEQQVALNPNNTAVVYEDESLSYDELNRKANQLAYTLREMGVKSDSIVAIMVERSLEIVFGKLKSKQCGT